MKSNNSLFIEESKRINDMLFSDMKLIHDWKPIINTDYFFCSVELHGEKYLLYFKDGSEYIFIPGYLSSYKADYNGVIKYKVNGKELLLRYYSKDEDKYEFKEYHYTYNSDRSIMMSCSINTSYEHESIDEILENSKESMVDYFNNKTSKDVIRNNNPYIMNTTIIKDDESIKACVDNGVRVMNCYDELLINVADSLLFNGPVLKKES